MRLRIACSPVFAPLILLPHLARCQDALVFEVKRVVLIEKPGTMAAPAKNDEELCGLGRADRVAVAF